MNKVILVLCFGVAFSLKGIAGTAKHHSSSRALKALREVREKMSKKGAPDKFEKIKKNKIPLGIGDSLLKRLRDSRGSTQNTMTSREEKKATTTAEQLELMQADLAKNRIIFGKRDIGSGDKENMNFTFYGRGAKFTNHGGVKTSINFRIRIYVERTKVSGRFHYTRSPLTTDRAFLEVKVKNPSADELNSVDKFRILVADKDLIELVLKDPTDKDYSNFLKSIKKRCLRYRENSNPSIAHAIFATIHELSLRDRKYKDVTRYPIVSYVREAYAYDERAYPLHLPGKDSPTTKDVQYQITVDRKIQIFRSNILQDDVTLQPEKYLSHKFANSLMGHYPEHVRIIEFKSPRPISEYPPTLRSSTHNVITKSFLTPMQLHALEGFELDKGKSFHARRFVATALLKDSKISTGILPDLNRQALIRFRLGLDKGWKLFTPDAPAFATPQSNHLPIIRLIVESIEGHSILVNIKKSAHHDKDRHWEFIGGSPEIGETLWAAMLRESREEDPSLEIFQLLQKVEAKTIPAQTKTLTIKTSARDTKVILIHVMLPADYKLAPAKSHESRGHRWLEPSRLDVFGNPIKIQKQHRWTRQAIKILRELRS